MAAISMTTPEAWFSPYSTGKLAVRSQKFQYENGVLPVFERMAKSTAQPIE